MTPITSPPQMYPCWAATPPAMREIEDARREWHLLRASRLMANCCCSDVDDDGDNDYDLDEGLKVDDDMTDRS